MEDRLSKVEAGKDFLARCMMTAASGHRVFSGLPVTENIARNSAYGKIRVTEEDLARYRALPFSKESE
jgi:hypothetical protein